MTSADESWLQEYKRRRLIYRAIAIAAYAVALAFGLHTFKWQWAVEFCPEDRDRVVFAIDHVPVGKKDAHACETHPSWPPGDGFEFPYGVFARGDDRETLIGFFGLIAFLFAGRYLWTRVI